MRIIPPPSPTPSASRTHTFSTYKSQREICVLDQQLLKFRNVSNLRLFTNDRSTWSPSHRSVWHATVHQENLFFFLWEFYNFAVLAFAKKYFPHHDLTFYFQVLTVYPCFKILRIRISNRPLSVFHRRTVLTFIRLIPELCPQCINPK